MMPFEYFDNSVRPITEAYRLEPLQHLKHPEDYSAFDKENHFGISERQNLAHRSKHHEDRVACGIFNNSNPIYHQHSYEIALRLYQSYLQLQTKLFQENPKERSGSTATTVIHAQGKLITATCGDSMSYVAMADCHGKIRGVRRLNLRYHRADLAYEAKRIEEAGGFVEMGELGGEIEISRSFGDKQFADLGMIAVPNIDIHDLNTIRQEFGLSPDEMGEAFVISISDGVHDARSQNLDKLNIQDITSDETLLFDILNQMNLMDPNERVMARAITNYAINNALTTGKPCILDDHLYDIELPLCGKLSEQDSRSRDNTTALVQRLDINKASYQSVYDGHMGDGTAIFLARNTRPMLENMLRCPFNTMNKELFEPFFIHCDLSQLPYLEQTQEEQMIDSNHFLFQ